MKIQVLSVDHYGETNMQINKELVRQVAVEPQTYLNDLEDFLIAEGWTRATAVNGTSTESWQNGFKLVSISGNSAALTAYGRVCYNGTKAGCLAALEMLKSTGRNY